MSRKNYVAVAAIVSKNYAAAAAADNYSHAGQDCHRALVRQVAYDLCHCFAADNPRFQEAKFLAACGLHKSS